MAHMVNIMIKLTSFDIKWLSFFFELFDLSPLLLIFRLLVTLVMNTVFLASSLLLTLSCRVYLVIFVVRWVLRFKTHMSSCSWMIFRVFCWTLVGEHLKSDLLPGLLSAAVEDDCDKDEENSTEDDDNGHRVADCFGGEEARDRAFSAQLSHVIDYIKYEV